MTTIVGISANKGKKGVVLASDLTATRNIWTPKIDAYVREQERQEFPQKIFVSDNREVAIATAGSYDQFHSNFIAEVMNGKINVKSAIEKGRFDEVTYMQLERWGYDSPDESGNEFLVATRFDNNPRLFNVRLLGRVREIPCYAIGSGGKLAFQYINDQGDLIPGRVNLRRGLELAINGVKKAHKDPFTGGLDVVVISENEIDDQIGSSIKQELNLAYNQAVEKQLARYS